MESQTVQALKNKLHRLRTERAVLAVACSHITKPNNNTIAAAKMYGAKCDEIASVEVELVRAERHESDVQELRDQLHRLRGEYAVIRDSTAKAISPELAAVQLDMMLRVDAQIEGVKAKLKAAAEISS